MEFFVLVFWKLFYHGIHISDLSFAKTDLKFQLESCLCGRSAAVTFKSKYIGLVITLSSCSLQTGYHLVLSFIIYDWVSSTHKRNFSEFFWNSMTVDMFIFDFRTYFKILSGSWTFDVSLYFTESNFSVLFVKILKLILSKSNMLSFMHILICFSATSLLTLLQMNCSCVK